MPIGIGTSDLSLDVAAPVASIRVVSGPSRPYAPLADGAVSWRAISHLSLNYLSLTQSTPEEGAAALRDLLELYAASADVSARRQIEGIRSVRVGRVVRRLRAPGPLAFGRGLEITVHDRRAGVRGRERVPARIGARSILRAPRVDQLVHGNRAAVREPRGNQPMGAAMGRETDALAFFAALAEAPYRYDFYQTLRRLECLYARQAALGRSPASGRRAGAARTGSRPVVRARAAGIVRDRTAASRRGCRCRLFGLFGPNGPLPLHLTEYARERLRLAGDPTLSRFLDIFHHRFLALFYRAWAQAQPHVNRDRPKDDRFTIYVGAFVGMSPAAFRDRDALPDLAKFFHVGALIRQVRNAEGLAHILQHFFRVPVEIEEFVGHWMLLGAGERTLLSQRARRSAPAPCSAAACGIVSTSSGFVSAR